MAKKREKPVAFCTFCLRPYTDFNHLVSANDDLLICDKCVDICHNISPPKINVLIIS